MLAQKIKEYRAQNSLTQAQLAAKLGVSASAVGMYEQGRRLPDGNLLAHMAVLLNCTTDELLDVKKPNEVEEVIDSFARSLQNRPGLMYNGAPLTKSDREKLVNAIRIAAAISSGGR